MRRKTAASMRGRWTAGTQAPTAEEQRTPGVLKTRLMRE